MDVLIKLIRYFIQNIASLSKLPSKPLIYTMRNSNKVHTYLKAQTSTRSTNSVKYTRRFDKKYSCHNIDLH